MKRENDKLAKHLKLEGIISEGITIMLFKIIIIVLEVPYDITKVLTIYHR
jgi:hypothetical protein